MMQCIFVNRKIRIRFRSSVKFRMILQFNMPDFSHIKEIDRIVNKVHMINLNDGNIERFRLICFYTKFVSKGMRIFTAASQVKIKKKVERVVMAYGFVPGQRHLCLGAAFLRLTGGIHPFLIPKPNVSANYNET